MNGLDVGGRAETSAEVEVWSTVPLCACGCGARFLPRQQSQKYADPVKCRDRAKTQRRSAARKAARPPRPCACGCGVPFIPERQGQKYATPKCHWTRQNRRRGHQPKQKKCRCGCGRLFTSQGKQHLHASAECEARADARRRERRPKRWKRLCRCGCGTRFRTAIRTQRYLSGEHKRMATWKKQSATRKVNAAARRAQRDFIGTALIEALRAEVPAHLCIYCERPLSGIQRFICRRVDSDGDKCVRLYNSDWRRGQRMRHATEAAWKLKRRKCQHPECTGRFYPKQEQDTHCVAHRGTPSAL